MANPQPPYGSAARYKYASKVQTPRPWMKSPSAKSSASAVLSRSFATPRRGTLRSSGSTFLFTPQRGSRTQSKLFYIKYMWQKRRRVICAAANIFLLCHTSTSYGLWHRCGDAIGNLARLTITTSSQAFVVVCLSVRSVLTDRNIRIESIRCF